MTVIIYLDMLENFIFSQLKEEKIEVFRDGALLLLLTSFHLL
jgi:hypothetical protein